MAGGGRLRAIALNAGSSSLKASLFDFAPTRPLANPAAPTWEAQVELARGDSFGAATEQLLNRLFVSTGDDSPELDLIAHRIVHGGEMYREPVRLSEPVKRQIRAQSRFAPLHNPAALSAIEAAERTLPAETPHVALFDTAFHAAMEPAAHTYAGPKKWLDSGLRRYGFHGLNHHYLAYRAAHLLKRELKELRLVTCHLGSGASLAAVRAGRSQDTTMGFTPLDGVAMSTRSGSVDPGLLIHLLRAGTTVNELDEILNYQSGLAGLSGTTGDMREVLAGCSRGEAQAQLAFDVYIHRVRRGIGGMLAGLGGLDALVFSGGIGENVPSLRAAAVEPFAFLGVELNPTANHELCADADIATDASRVRILVIAARENWSIVRQASDLLRREFRGDRA